MAHRFFDEHFADQFTPDEVIDVSKYVDDCVCGCRSHFTVKNGLIHVHDKPIFDRLLVEGDLGLRNNADLRRLPEVLAVSGSVYLSDCVNLKQMPGKMFVGGDIYMERTDVRELPKVTVVGGTIHAGRCAKLVEIPAGIRAAAIQAPGCEKLKNIASGISVGSIDLSHGPIAELPADLAITTLKLRHCSELAMIPEGVVVSQFLDITGCHSLFTLPNSVQPKMVISDGVLFATDCLILPKMSEVQASMCLGVKAIEAFPHAHLKNIERMQESVRSVEHKLKAGSSACSFATLNGDRMWSRNPDAFATLNQRLKSEAVRALLQETTVVRRLNGPTR